MIMDPARALMHETFVTEGIFCTNSVHSIQNVVTFVTTEKSSSRTISSRYSVMEGSLEGEMVGVVKVGFEVGRTLGVWEGSDIDGSLVGSEKDGE